MTDESITIENTKRQRVNPLKALDKRIDALSARMARLETFYDRLSGRRLKEAEEHASEVSRMLQALLLRHNVLTECSRYVEHHAPDQANEFIMMVLRAWDRPDDWWRRGEKQFHEFDIEQWVRYIVEADKADKGRNYR